MKGRVEVKVKNKWYGVCGIGFGNTAAEVLCRELGLGYAIRAFSSSKFGTILFIGFRGSLRLFVRHSYFLFAKHLSSQAFVCSSFI